MASNGSTEPDPDDNRRFAGLPLNENHAYYPRYYPDWHYDPYRLSLAERDEYYSNIDGDKIKSFRPNSFPQAYPYDNLGFYTLSGPRKGESYKVDSSGSIESSDDFRTGGHRRRCIVVSCIVAVVLLLAVSAGIGLYFGVYDRPDSRGVQSSDPSTVTPTTPDSSTSSPATAASYEASLTLDRTYNPDLDDPSSPAYISLKNDVENVVNTNLRNSDLNSAFIGGSVSGFRRGSVVAVLKLDFSSNEVVIANQPSSLTRTLVVNELKEELRKDTTQVVRLNIEVDRTLVEERPVSGEADLGESCNGVSDCADRNTQCSGSPLVCNCVDGYYQNGGICNPKIGYGSTCTEGSHCVTGVCTDSRCDCEDTHFYKNNACILKISINSQGCDVTSHCATSGAVCSAGTCVCPQTTFFDEDQCLPKIGINTAGCSADSHCATPGAVCSSGTCICNPAAFFFDGISCAAKKDLGESCARTEECAAALGECVNNVCQCPSNRYSDGQECLTKKQNGEDCLSDIECLATGSVCDNLSGQCSCTSTMFLDGTVCINKKSHGEQCTSSDECLVTGSACNAGTCGCSSTTFLQGNSCINKKANGESCSSVSECLAQDSVCSSGVCGCPAFRYLDGTSCLNKKLNGQDCSSADECLVTGSVCDSTSGQCSCSSTMYLQGMTCVNKKANGDSCSSNNECLVMDSVCGGGICGCPATSYLEGTNCLTKKLNGENCLSSMECLVTGSVCDGASGTCSCPAAMYLDGMTCRNQKSNGLACSSEVECLVTNSVCDGGLCGCPANTYLEGMSCLNKKGNGEACTSSLECLVSDSICNGGQCDCPSTMYLQGLSCLNKKGNGEVCTSSLECLVSDSVCNGGRCGCPSTMYLQEMSCLNKKSNGEACTSSLECLVSDSICNGGRCDCPSTKYLEGLSCLDKKGNGQACTSSLECFVSDAICNGGQCGCPSTTYLQGMSCLNKKGNGEACSLAMECLVTGAICDSGLCGCPDNTYLQAMSCLNKKGYNENCLQDIECMMPDLVCRSSLCQCILGKTYDGQMCVTTTTTSTSTSTQATTTEMPTTTEPTTEATEPTTKMPTTEATEPTTKMPTTEATEPTTKMPTTEATETTTKMPTTEATETTTKMPTTEATEPTTKMPTTEATETTTKMPTTEATEPTTKMPTTEATEPTTKMPTTEASEPTTKMPTTEATEPTTKMPTTEATETTTKMPTTEATEPTTKMPTTEATEPTTKMPTTEATEPTTKMPTTEATEPTTKMPTTEATGPTTKMPTTEATETTTKMSTTEATEPTTKMPTTEATEPTTKMATTETTEPTMMMATTETTEPTTKMATTETTEPTTKMATTETTEPTTKMATTEPTTEMKTTDSTEPSTKTVTTSTESVTQSSTKMTSTSTMSSTAMPTQTTDATQSTGTTPTTSVPVTTAPDETPTVEFNGTVKSDTPYDPQLADPTSALYQNYSEEFKKTVEERLRQEGQEGEVTSITFSNGSIITDYILVLPVVLIVTPETRQDVIELPSKLQEMVLPIVDKIFTAIVNDTKAPTFLQAIDVTTATEIEVIPDPPCKNGITLLDYAENKVCGEILTYLVNISVDDTCRAYRALLDCVSLMYSYESEVCSWNKMRANFEKKVMMALGLQDKDISDCVPGNYYEFAPVGPVRAAEPCMDVNLMIQTAKYECHLVYNSMTMNPPVACSDVELIEECMMARLQGHYENCTVDTSVPEYGLSMMVEYQEQFFPNDDVQLTTCEFCVAPNLEEIMRTNCILPLYFTNVWQFIGSECSLLHSMILCVEAQTSLWSTDSCRLPDIVSVIKADQDRFYKLLSQVPAFQGDGFSQCLDEEISNIGPPVSGNLCENHNYIAYVFVFECTDWLRISSGNVVDQCSEHLIGTQCVLSHFNDVLGLQCSYEGVYSAIWERNHPVSILDYLQSTGFPGTECTDRFATDAGQCQVTFFSQLPAVYQACVLFMDEELNRKLMNIPEMACGMYSETTRCALREVVVYSDPLCKLEDIEPAVMTGVFRDYPDIMNCPSQGSGPYNREALCHDPDSLGSTLLAFCGSELMQPDSPVPEECGDLKNFSECTMVLGSHQDFILSLCNKSDIADSFHMLDGTLTQYFSVDQQCFVTQPGQCVAPLEDEEVTGCANPSRGVMSCLLDSQCGGLEKCCSSGCNMECTNYIEDINPKNGTCPPLPETVLCGESEHACYVDEHCDGEAKCCFDGCNTYCREAGGIYTPADCRWSETIQSTILACSMELTLSYDSCRSFSDLVGCVQKRLVKNSYNGVQCQFENTQEDVANQVRDLFGMYSYCRVYHSWISISEDNCSDSSITDMKSAAGMKFINETTPLLQTVFGEEEFHIIAVDFVGGDNCNPVMIQTLTYALTTVEELQSTVSERIFNLTESGQIEKDVALVIMQYEYPNFDKCIDPPTVLSSMSKCLPQFADRSYKYDTWESCEPVQRLVICTAEKTESVCDLRELKSSLIMDRREIVLEELKHEAGTTKLARAIESYDLETCETRGDVYPCWDELRIEDAVKMCAEDVDLSGFVVNGNAFDNYGITPHNCGVIFDLMSCATQKIRSLGADCDFSSSYTGDLVHKYLMETVLNGDQLPQESTQIMIYCTDYMPVCNAAYISQAYDTDCYMPYFHDRSTLPHLLTDDCNSTEAKNAFKELVTCLRLTALMRNETECTASRIVDIIDSDYQKLKLFHTDADLQMCIGSAASDLDAEVMTKDMVCGSREALSYFTQKCSHSGDCPIDIDALPEDVDLKCDSYFWLTGCVETQILYKMGIQCAAGEISAVDMAGTALGIESTTRNQCLSKLDDEFLSCEYPIIQNKEQFRPCYSALHILQEFALSPEETCNMYYEALYCMRTILEYFEHIPCDPAKHNEIVTDKMIDFLTMEAHLDAQQNCTTNPNTTYIEAFSSCSAVTCEEVTQDTGKIFRSASSCGISLFTIERDLPKYTCKESIEKFTCVTNELNDGLPLFYGCKTQTLIDQIIDFVGPDGVTTSFNITTCNEWEVTVTYFSQFCNNGVVPASFETDFRNNKLPLIMAGLDYEYRKASCGSIKFDVAVWTDLVESDLQQQLNTVVYTDSNFLGESIVIDLKQIPRGPYWCRDMSALRYFAVHCVKDQEFWYMDWQTCSPVYGLGECIVEKIHKVGGYWCDSEEVVHRLLNNDTVRENVTSDILTELMTDNRTLMGRERQWMEVLDRYSVEKCPAGKSEVYPCVDDKKKQEVYGVCRTHVMPRISVNMSLPNYGLTPGNCRDFFDLVSCVVNEFSKLRVQCLDIQEFVYEKLKEEFDSQQVLPPSHMDIPYCGDFEPVCSPHFIMEAKSRCPWTQDNSYRTLNCSFEGDKRVAMNFLTCVRLYALSRNQNECTATRIKGIIAADYFKLNIIIKSDDINRCLPEESISSLLPSRDSVCTGGSVVSLFEGYCVQNNTAAGTCPLISRNIMERDVDLGCGLYLSQMSCIQTILANSTFTCSLDQLANSPIPDRSPLHLRQNYTTQCLDIYHVTGFQHCEAGLIADSEALVCTYLLTSIMPSLMRQDQNNLCLLYQETLRCYDDLAKRKGLNCSADQLHNYQLDAMVLQQYSYRPVSECEDPLDRLPFHTCPAVIPEGNLCNSPDRLRNFVLGLCVDIVNQTGVLVDDLLGTVGNAAKCSLFQSMIWCGTNVTLYIGHPCSEDQVKSALLENNSTISSVIPDLDIDVCSVEPVRWFVELRFGNESFTADLADPASLAYNIFIYMKYYNLISALFGQFGRYEILDIRDSDGVVALTYYVWSVENPYMPLFSKLATQFRADLPNIMIGAIYEDKPVEPARWFVALHFENETYSREMADRTSMAYDNFVNEKYHRLISTLFEQFVRYEIISVREGSVVLSVYVWSAEHPHQMLMDKMEMEFPDAMRNIRVGNIFEDPDKKCSAPFVEKAMREECSVPYFKIENAMDDGERCRHFQAFLACIKYHALLNDEQCPLQELDSLVRMETSLKWTPLCVGDPNFEENFPDSKEEICNNSYVHRHLWEYSCINFDISAVTEPDNRCRTEMSRRGCVLAVLEQARVGCTMANVVEVSKRPEVRLGILDSVQPGCESSLRDTPCMKYFITEAAVKAEKCFPSLYSLQALVSMETYNEINMMRTSDGQNSLKCRLFEETLSCFISSVQRFPARDTEPLNCTTADLAPALISAHHIYYEIAASEITDMRSFPEIPYRECQANLTSDRPSRECPSPSRVADLVVGTCAARVLGGRMDADSDPCLMYDTFMDCMREVYIPNIEMCPDDYLWMSLQEYSWYISEHMGGFDYMQCKAHKSCSMDEIRQTYLPRCEYYITEMRSADDSQRCRLFEGMVKCVLETMDNEGEHCGYEELLKSIADSDTFIELSQGWDWSYHSQCEVQDSCQDLGVIRRSIGEACYSLLEVVNSTPNSSRENCNAFLALYRCVDANMKRNDHYCDRDTLSRALVNFIPGFDLDYCLGLRCSPLFIEKAKEEECVLPYWQMIRTGDPERCRHFEAFLGCIKYHALLNNEICPVQELEKMVAEATDIGEFSICQVCDYHWRIPNGQGEVMMHFDLDRDLVSVTLKAYNFDADSEWLGFGISYDKQMARSDIYTAQMSSSLGWSVTDRFAEGRFKPKPDIEMNGRNDIHDVYGYMDGNTVKVHFTRPIDTGNTETDVSFISDRYLLFARGRLDNNRDISYHSFRTTSERPFLFSCDPYSGFDNKFPDFKEEVCLNPYIQRGILEYNCLNFDMNSIQDPDYRCRFEIVTRSCLLAILQQAEVGCTMENVMDVYRQPELRNGLLDSIEPDCDSRLTDGPCEVDFYMRADLEAQDCFLGLYSLPFFSVFTDVNTIPSSNSSKGSLKCSLYDQALQCYTNLPGVSETCTPRDVAPALGHLMNILEIIMTSTDSLPGMNDTQRSISLTKCEASQFCTDIDYIKTQFEPFCESQLESFVDNMWGNNSCQYFDEFVDCMIEEMEAQQLYCSYTDIKKRIADHTHEMTNYDWNYEWNCQRKQWVAELYFRNETFVQDMYDNSSPAFKNFAQKYSHLISTILQQFGGGQIKYLYEGSVFMGLSFWTIHDPQEQISSVLWTQFAADMTNITVMYIYRDIENKCLDSVHIREIATIGCRRELSAVEEEPDNCRLFTNLLDCISTSLAMEDVHCEIDTVVKQLTGESALGTRAILPPDFNLDNCKSLKCTAWFVERARYEECVQPYMKINSTADSCRHYGEFLGCIKYHALINDEECPVADLDEMVQKMLMRPGLDVCIDYDEFESMFPATKPEICNSSAIVRHILENNCMELDISILTDPLDQCRLELSFRGCVQAILEKDVGCDMENIALVMRRDEVRQDLLDGATPDFCDANLLDSQCELDFYSKAVVREKCFDAIGGLYYSSIFLDVNEVVSSNTSSGKLKCSMFVEALRCFTDVQDFYETCSPSDLAPALRRAMHIYQELLPTELDNITAADYQQRNISLLECEANVPEEFPMRSCPSTSVVADIAMSRCAAAVLYGMRMHQMEPCMSLTGFGDCVRQIALPEQCPENHLMTSIEEHSSYFAQVIDGFDPVRCRAEQECWTMLSDVSMNSNHSQTIEEKCFAPVYMAFYLASVYLTEFDSCMLIQTVLLEAETCLLNSLPDFCDSAISGIVQQRASYLSYYGFNISQCTDIPPDPCSIFDMQGLLKCYQVLEDGRNRDTVHCRFQDCFHKVAPLECGFSDTEIDMYAHSAFQKVTGGMTLPSCSDTQGCMAQLDSMSDYCFAPFMQLRGLNALKSRYPNSAFEYGQTEGCGLAKMVSMCLKWYLVNDESCQAQTWSMIQNFTMMSDIDWNMEFSIYQCSEEENIDECVATELFILLQCQEYLPYSCNFQRCVADNLQKFPHCYTDADEEAVTARIYHSFTGYDIPDCYGLVVPCDLSGCSDVMYATCFFMYCYCDENSQEEDRSDGRRLPLCIQPNETNPGP